MLFRSRLPHHSGRLLASRGRRSELGRLLAWWELVRSCAVTAGLTIRSERIAKREKRVHGAEEPSTRDRTFLSRASVSPGAVEIESQQQSRVCRAPLDTRANHAAKIGRGAARESALQPSCREFFFGGGGCAGTTSFEFCVAAVLFS